MCLVVGGRLPVGPRLPPRLRQARIVSSTRYFITQSRRLYVFVSHTNIARTNRRSRPPRRKKSSRARGECSLGCARERTGAVDGERREATLAKNCFFSGYECTITSSCTGLAEIRTVATRSKGRHRTPAHTRSLRQAAPRLRRRAHHGAHGDGDAAALARGLRDPRHAVPTHTPRRAARALSLSLSLSREKRYVRARGTSFARRSRSAERTYERACFSRCDARRSETAFFRGSRAPQRWPLFYFFNSLIVTLRAVFR